MLPEIAVPIRFNLGELCEPFATLRIKCIKNSLTQSVFTRQTRKFLVQIKLTFFISLHTLRFLFFFSPRKPYCNYERLTEFTF